MLSIDIDGQSLNRGGREGEGKKVRKRQMMWMDVIEFSIGHGEGKVVSARIGRKGWGYGLSRAGRKPGKGPNTV